MSLMEIAKKRIACTKNETNLNDVADRLYVLKGKGKFTESEYEELSGLVFQRRLDMNGT